MTYPEIPIPRETGSNFEFVQTVRQYARQSEAEMLLNLAERRGCGASERELDERRAAMAYVLEYRAQHKDEQIAKAAAEERRQADARARILHREVIQSSLIGGALSALIAWLLAVLWS